MKLIDYVIKHDTNIKNIKEVAKFVGFNIKEYMLTGYCPCSFDCLANTEYNKPLSQHKKDKKDCNYRYTDNQKKCNECWDREVLTVKE